MILRILLLIVTLAFLHESKAQKLTVESMKPAPMDLSASQYKRRDLNGNSCALIKVQTAYKGLLFEGNTVGSIDQKTGEYWVYMSQNSYLLVIKHPDFLPLSINFKDYDIQGVSSLETYVLTISGSTNIQNRKIETFTVEGNTFRMIGVEGGSFIMGAPLNHYAHEDEQPAHRVTLDEFMMGETEVTQGLWLAVMGSNPSKWKGEKLPVERVSWKACQKFISKLNKLTGRKFRLPTEAEWEYAARGGNKSKGFRYSGSDELDSVAWYGYNSSEKTHEVGQKRANEIGLYDMSGNVFEICDEAYTAYSSEDQKNPHCPYANHLYIVRGGSWYSYAGCWAVYRREAAPHDSRSYYIGLRLAM